VSHTHIPKPTLGPMRQSEWLRRRCLELAAAILNRLNDPEAPPEQLHSVLDWCDQLKNTVDRCLSASLFEKKVDESKGKQK